MLRFVIEIVFDFVSDFLFGRIINFLFFKNENKIVACAAALTSFGISFIAGWLAKELFLESSSEGLDLLLAVLCVAFGFNGYRMFRHYLDLDTINESTDS